MSSDPPDEAAPAAPAAAIAPSAPAAAIAHSAPAVAIAPSAPAAAVDAAAPAAAVDAAAPAAAAASAAAAQHPAAEAPAAATLDPVACAAQLKLRFPALFSGAPKPIKLRIQADIQERAPGVFTRQALSAFLRRHTGSTSYLIALTRSSQRYDLDGQAAGELSEEHRQAAAQELARRRQLRQEREEREASERRARAGLLRDFERTTLTPANFCALKGVPLEQLDALLELARQEAAAWAQQHPQPPRPGPRGDGHAPGPRAEARGPRGEPGPGTAQRPHRPPRERDGAKRGPR